MNKRLVFVREKVKFPVVLKGKGSTLAAHCQKWQEPSLSFPMGGRRMGRANGLSTIKGSDAASQITERRRLKWHFGKLLELAVASAELVQQWCARKTRASQRKCCLGAAVAAAPAAWSLATSSEDYKGEDCCPVALRFRVLIADIHQSVISIYQSNIYHAEPVHARAIRPLFLFGNPFLLQQGEN